MQQCEDFILSSLVRPYAFWDNMGTGHDGNVGNRHPKY